MEATNNATNRDDKTGGRHNLRTRAIYRRIRRRLLHFLKEAAVPTFTTLTFLVFPTVAVLAATGVRNVHDFWDAVRNGDPGTATAIALFLMTGTAGAHALRQHKTANEQKRVLDDLRETHRKDAEEVRNLLRTLNGLDDTNKHLLGALDEKSVQIAALEHKMNALLEKISSGGLEEEDVKELWKTAAGTSMTTFQGMFNREVTEVPRSNGRVEFQATEWAENVLRRITVGTALKEWKIIFYIPEVDRRPFAELGLLPVRKFLFLIDHLVKVAKSQGKETSLAHLRIAIVREVEPKDEHRSIFVLTREIGGSAEELVITYHRPPTHRVTDYNAGKVTVHRGDADQRFYKDTVADYFYPDYIKRTGFQVTLDELRQAVTTGVFPDVKSEMTDYSGAHIAVSHRG